MTSTKFLWATFVSAWLVSPLPLLADDFEAAVRAALDEPPAGQPVLFEPTYVLSGHKFGVTPVQTTSGKKGPYSVTGQLTRSKADGTTDVIHYRIRRDKGALMEMSMRINNGEWRGLSDPLLKVLGEYAKGVVLPADKHKEVSTSLRAAMDGSWQQAAEYLIIQIGVRHC